VQIENLHGGKRRVDECSSREQLRSHLVVFGNRLACAESL
jgi:hypothetical protein